MTHWNECELRGNGPLVLKRSVILMDASKLNLNANLVHWHMCRMCSALVCMLMNYKRLVDRFHVASLSLESVVRQSGRPQSQTSLLSSGRPSDPPDWLVQPDNLSFVAMICIPIGWTKCLQSVVGSASNWDVGKELWTRPELSGTLAESPRYSGAVRHRDKHTHIHTHTHIQQKSNTLCLQHKAPMLPVTYLQSCVLPEFQWMQDFCALQRYPASANTNTLNPSWYFAYMSQRRDLILFPPTRRRQTHTQSQGGSWCVRPIAPVGPLSWFVWQIALTSASYSNGESDRETCVCLCKG